MSEWLKEHAWKACVLQKGTVSSNLTLSAKEFRPNEVGLLFYSTVEPNLFMFHSAIKQKTL
jgi:hypothetical protein